MSSNSHMEGRTDGAALRTLSKLQIRSLIAMAREAFGQEFPPSGESFDEWRHRQCALAVERGGFTECRNEDYLPLKAHFLRLSGHVQQADAALAKYSVEPRTWALAAFDKAVREANAAAQAAGLALDAHTYACGFLRNKRSVNLEDADTKSIWQAVYLLNRKAKQIGGGV